MGPCLSRGGGFTLLEILVALAILAVALAAGMRVAGLSTGISVELRQRTLALWVAQNRLAEHRARKDWPAVGEGGGDVRQDGEAFRWRETVDGTPRPDFRRIRVRVFAEDRPDHALADLAGYQFKQ